jgi:hypothetical protein
MRRMSRWARPFNALFALWFAAVLGDPGFMHACPMHGGHLAPVAAVPVAAAPQSEHAMHGHTSAHHEEAPSSESSHQHGSQGPCTCVGHCCAAPAVAPLATVAHFTVPAHVAQPTQRPEFPSDDAPAWPDLRLPFANGPPSA